MCRRCHTIAWLLVALWVGLPPLAAEPAATVGAIGPLAALARMPLADEPSAAEASTADVRTPYVAGIIGSSFAAAGGDAGSVGGTLLTGEGALGVSVPRPLGGVRFEIEGRQRAALSGTRLGPPTAAAAPAATVAGEWTTMANVWRDVSLADHLSLYAGGGAGVGGYSHDADGEGPAAASHVAAFGWQAGGGVAYAVTDRLTLDVGCRVYGLEAGAGQPAAGAPAAEMLFAVRVSDPFRGWLRR